MKTYRLIPHSPEEYSSSDFAVALLCLLDNGYHTGWDVWVDDDEDRSRSFKLDGCWISHRYTKIGHEVGQLVFDRARGAFLIRVTDERGVPADHGPIDISSLIGGAQTMVEPFATREEAEEWEWDGKS